MNDEKKLTHASAEDYLRHKYGAHRGSFSWRDEEAAFNAGVESKAKQIHSIAECGRCLGVAQVKNDQGAIDHWQSELDKLLKQDI